jgi:hypothetical protein
MKEVIQPTTPDIAQRGKLIELVNPAPEVRRAAESNSEWDLSQEAAKLYRRADVIMDRFYHGIPTPGFDGKLPAPLIAIDSMNIRTLAAYLLVPDEYGLRYKITVNEQHYVAADDPDGHNAVAWRFGEWALMETLTHELGHHWQQLRGRDPFKQGKVTHNREFTAKLEELGIYSTTGHGAHYKQADVDKPFGILMKEWGIARPEVPDEVVPPKIDWFKFFESIFGSPSPKGRSSLARWECPECHLKIRVGIKSDPKLIHHPCSEKTGRQVFFVNTDGLSHTIFEAPRDPPAMAQGDQPVVLVGPPTTADRP